MIQWAIVLLILEIIPFILYRLGHKYLINPPKKKDASSYNGKGVNKSEETWVFAHHLAGELWYKAGFYLLGIVPLFMIFVIKQDLHSLILTGIVVIFIEICVFARSIVVIQTRLKKEFNEEGERTTDPDQPIEKDRSLYM